MLRCASARIIQGDQNATEVGDFLDSRPRIDKQWIYNSANNALIWDGRCIRKIAGL